MFGDALGVIWKRIPSRFRLKIIRATQRKFTASVGVIITNPNGKVLLLEHLLRPGSGWGIPGGFIEHGEQPETAVRREIREETGIVATLAGWAGSTRFRYPDTDGSPIFHVAYFIATGTATDEMAAHLESDLLLVPIETAAETVTIPALREMIERALPTLHALAGTDR